MTALRDHVNEWAVRVAEQAVEEVFNETLRAAPERTGALRQKLSTDPVAFDGGVVRTAIEDTAEYAGFTDAGTRPHVIRGNPTLVFFYPAVGRTVFYRFVNHPGTAGTRWFNGGDDGGEPMASRWRAALETAASQQQ